MNVPYYIARYADDPLRMETKNRGVIAIIENRLSARFLGEVDGGGLDSRKVRGHVRNTGAYKQWIDYWRYVINASNSPAAAIEELTNSSRFNYVVSEEATLTAPIEQHIDEEQIIEYLFNLLVSGFPEPRNEEHSLAQRCDEIVGEYHLRQNPHFAVSPTVACPLPNARTEHVQPSYGYVNGAEIYFQKVPMVGNKPEYSAKEVHNAAWILERLRVNRNERQTRALVKMALAVEFPDLLSVLEAVSTDIIDVDNLEQVHREFSPFVIPAH